MPLLIKCPYCKTFVAADRKECETQRGKGCGKRIAAEKRVYYAYWRDQKGNVQRKKIGPSKAAAENYLRKVETDLAEGRYIDRKKENKVTVKEHVTKDYLPFCETKNRGWGLRNKKVHLERIKERFGSRRLQDVTTDMVEAWRYEYAEQEKFVMWNRIFETLRAMYRRAVRKGIIEAVPFSTTDMKFDEDQERVRWLTEKEEAKLLKACSDHLRPIVLVALYTGLRKSDLLALRLGTEVDLENRLIRRKQDKTGGAVDLYLVDEVYEVVQELAKGKKSGDLLFTYQGRQLEDPKTAFNHAVEKAGIVDPHQERIKDLTFHDLRHCFACKLVKAGVDLYTVQKLLGHKSPKMTQRYAHLQPDHVMNAMARLSAKPKEGKVLAFTGTTAD